MRELADGTPLTEDEIHQVARAQLADLEDDDQTDLEQNWEKAYKYYKGEKRGDEVEGLSKVQSLDVSDVLEWTLPAIVKSLIEGPDVVRFDANGPEDQAQADVETDYTHHAFMKQAGGFLVCYEFIKDALLLKNGVTCTYWDEEKTSRPEEYEELRDEELAKLLNPTDDSEVRLETLESREVPAIDPASGLPLTDPQTGGPVTYTVNDVKIRRIQTRGRAAVEVCVPERFRVRADQESIDLSKARFCSYQQRKAAAQLIALGYDKDKVAGLPDDDSGTGDDDEVRRARQDVERTAYDGNTETAQEVIDASQRMVALTRCYMTLDINGDGIEEYILVVLGGNDGQEILDWYEVPENPFNAVSPFPAAHKFWGYSLFDKIREIQDLKTKVIRMVGDNLDFHNNPGHKYMRGMVEDADLGVRRPGQHIRVEDMDAHQDTPVPQIEQHAYQLLDWADKMRGERTGVDPDSQSMTNAFPDESMNTAVERLLTAKEEVVSLMIRVFAELWFGPLMVKMRNLMMTHQHRPEIVKLGSKWYTVDPRNWTERNSTTVRVGLGTGDRLKKLSALTAVMQQQQAAVQAGQMGTLVTPSKIYQAEADFVRFSGLGDPDDYWLDPVKIQAEIAQAQQTQQAPSPEAQEAFMELQKIQQQQQAAQQQPPPPAPGAIDPQTAMAIEQMKAQSKAQSDQMDNQMKKMELMMDQQQFDAENKRKWAELAQKAQESAKELAIEAAQAVNSNQGGDQ